VYYQSYFIVTYFLKSGIFKCSVGAKDFSSSLCVQTRSEAYPAYSMGTRVSFSEGKARPGRDADHSPLSSTEVKNE
jgi:hypothetical protein